jgi:hypothetical protein
MASKFSDDGYSDLGMRDFGEKGARGTDPFTSVPAGHARRVAAFRDVDEHTQGLEDWQEGN